MKSSSKPLIVTALIFSVILIFSFYPTGVPACEIDVTIHGESSTSYKTGDIVILKVDVFLTHRNCPEDIDATEFQTQGMDILGATKWTEVSNNHFERLVKVEITASESSEAIFHTKRTCSKEGGSDYLKLNLAA